MALLQVIIIMISSMNFACVFGQTIQALPKAMHLNEGDNVTLDCYIRGFTSGNVIWYQDGSVQYFGSVSEVLDDPRKQLTLTEDHWTVTIRNLQVKDQGMWRCTLGDLETKTFLFVKAPVAIIDWTRPVDKQPRIRDTLTFFCNATGSPQPTIIWKRVKPVNYIYNIRNEREEFIVGDRITIINATEEHRGWYECSAGNGVGIPAKKEFHIHFPYVPVVTTYAPTVRLPKGRTGTMVSCTCNSYPAVTSETDVTWRKDGQVLSNGQNSYSYTISQAENQEVTSSVLTLPRITQQVAGTYTCIFRNSRGQGEESFKVIASDAIKPETGAVRSSAYFLSFHLVTMVTVVAMSFFIHS